MLGWRSLKMADFRRPERIDLQGLAWKVLRIMTFSTPSVRNNIRADICAGVQQPRVVSRVSCELHKMARADAFSTLRVSLEMVYHPVFLIARERSRFHVTGREEGRGRGRGGRGWRGKEGIGRSLRRFSLIYSAIIDAALAPASTGFGGHMETP